MRTVGVIQYEYAVSSSVSRDRESSVHPLWECVWPISKVLKKLRIGDPKLERATTLRWRGGLSSVGRIDKTTMALRFT